MVIDTLDTNLLASGKKPKPAEDRPSASVNVRRRVLKGLAYGAIFFAALLFFCFLKTPKSLVQGLALNALNQQRELQWQTDSVELKLFFLPHIRAEKLTVESRRPDATPITFDELRLFPSFLSLVTFSPRFSFDGKSYGAEFEGSFAPKNTALGLELKNADLTKLAPLLGAGANIQGVLSSLRTDVSLENNRLSRLTGTVQAEGKNFVLDPASMGIPIALPILNLGALTLKASAQNGKVRIESLQLGAAGRDLEVRVTGDVTLADIAPLSRIDLRLRLKPSEKILQAMPALRTTLGNMGALRPDGFYAMKMVGQLNGVILPTPDR